MADAIVVSEIGARLSPKILPLIIAPTIIPGLHPMLTANGTMIGVTAAHVPPVVPHAVEISTQVIKVISGRKFAFRCIWEDSQISPWINPLCLRS